MLSTSDIYKNQKYNLNLKESLKIDITKLTSYAKSKYKSEKYLESLKKKDYPFEKIILRLPGIIGKDNHKNFISNLTKDIISKKKLSYYGGDNLFNNIFHIDTLVNLLKKLINKGIKKNFDIINIGSNNPIKINKVVELLDGKIVKNPMKDSKKYVYN